MLKNLITLSSLSQKISSTLFRFPIVSICILFVVSLSLLKNHQLEFVHQNVLFSLIMLLVPFTALKLYKEQKKISNLFYFLLIVLIAYYVFFNVWHYKLNLVFIAFASISALIFTPYIFNKSTNKDILCFLWDGIIATLFAFVASLIFYLGLISIFAALKYLFDLGFSSSIYEDILIIAFLGLFPLLVLSGISKKYSYEDINIKASKMLKILVVYICLPLVFIYMLILYLYFFKILFQFELPKGNLASMIISFGIIGIFVKLLIYFLKNSASKMLSFFDKYYFYMMLVPIGMLCVSFFRRVSDYGITESRYAIFLFIVWFSFITIFSIIKKDSFNFKYIFISLSLLSFIATLPFLSANSVSAKSQLNRFKVLLEKNNLLKDNQIVKANYKLLSKQSIEFTSLVSYLVSNKIALKELNLMLKDIAKEKSIDSFDNTKEILEALEVKYLTKWMDTGISYELKNTIVSIKDYEHLVYLNSYTKIDLNYKYIDKLDNEKEVKIEFEDSRLKLDFQNNSKVEFNLSKLVKDLNAKNLEKLSAKDEDKLTLISYSNDKKYKVKVLATYIYSREDKVNTLKAYVMFKQL